MDVFEGSEKKCEVIVDSKHLNLREFSRKFWEEMVDCCKATILSSIHNHDCDAYLLSESSLFVWDDHFLLITCGQTKLVESILYFLERVDHDLIVQLLFQRKNEYFAEMQYSDFYSDVERIQQEIAGTVVTFGDLNAHYIQLFYLERPYILKEEDQSYELLMYDISEDVIQFLLKEDQEKEDLREFFNLDKMLPNFELDDFVFSPCGYSLNAILNEKYLTIHVTPQPEHSYVSFETNISLQEILNIPLDALEPKCFDMIVYQLEDEDLWNAKIPKKYQQKYSQKEVLDGGYTVHFYHRRLEG